MLTLLLASMLGLRMISVAKAEETVVAVDPPAVTATVGQIFSINITITDVYAEAGHGGLWFWAVSLRWNPDVLKVALDEWGEPMIEEGPFLSDVGPTLFLFDAPRNGSIPVVCCGLFADVEAEGSGTLATITFEAIAAGETDITIYETDLFDWSGGEENPIPHTVVDGHITVLSKEHDLAVSLDAPRHIIPQDSWVLNTTVFNFGLCVEVDVELRLLINGSMVDSKVIPSLQVGSSYTLSYLWTPTVEAIYNVTAYAPPVDGEEFTSNNVESVRVVVSYEIRVPQHFSKIQEAVDAANPGDIIRVAAGTYCDRVCLPPPWWTDCVIWISKDRLRLVGEDPSTTVIDGEKKRFSVVAITARYVEVTGFTIQNGYEVGIWLYENQGVTVSGNVITTGRYGIFTSYSTDCVIIENTISDNDVGIDLLGGNMIYHNDFINNTQQAEVYGENTWDDDYPSGGNYWSDYVSVDVKSGPNQDQPSSDGIGDTPYVIDANNIDHYPLMYPWGAPPPPSYTLTIYSAPTGLTFTVDGVSCTTPWSGTYYESALVDLVMPSIHVVGEARYYWDQWSDGVTSRSRTVTMKTNTTLTANYTGPYYQLVDVYTQKEPYSGKGPNQSSDAFAPQEEVQLYAYVSYHGDPVANMLVAFEVNDPTGETHLYRTNSTDENGIATTSFRIPTTPTFGEWAVYATVDIAETTVNDILTFKVGWIIEVTQIKTVNYDGNPKTSFTKGEHVHFNVTIRNIAFTSKEATITIVVYDECGVPIGHVTLQNWLIPPGTTQIFIIDLQIPKWAYVGVAAIYVNAYTDLPTQEGTPTCPEKSTTFLITKT